jgi:CPA2 family monovalent cation:H+ antiporter-2
MAGNLLQDALIYLGTAIIFVPVAKKLGIGSVLGYIIGGVIVGPYALELIGNEGEDVMHAAEFGVVMMLFLIGLELNPKSFWNMRKVIVGMGGVQMALTTVLIFLALYFFLSLTFNAALALALSFSMSSTAIVLQTLKEKSLDKTHAGQSSFSILLFQDIAVIPVLALLPLLALSEPKQTSEHHLPDQLAFLESYPTITLLGAVVLVYILSRFLASPLLHLIARVHMRELFTAAALFLVIGVAWVMEQAGISAALGAFMAGVLLANSEFRHELESDIEPFKGLLLGVFFTAVGATINFSILTNRPADILITVFVLMIIKGIVLFFLGRIFKLVSDQNILLVLLLSQVGEFAFVLLGSIQQFNIINKETLDFYMATVTLTMIISPLLLFINERYIAPYLGVKKAEDTSRHDIIEETGKVILIGFSHFGSTLGRFLRANGIYPTILDNDSDTVALLRKMGFKVYYGDGTRLDLLEAAGASEAEIIVSSIASPDKNYELTEIVNKHFPHIRLFIRAKNRVDAYELLDKGVKNVYRSSLHASVFMGVDVLSTLGFRRYTLHRKANQFIKYDEAALTKLAKLRFDKERYIGGVKEEIEIQEKLLNEDVKFQEKGTDNSWDKSSLQ